VKEITREWLRSAECDLEVIEGIRGRESLTHMVAFHAQQAIEKCLKAILEEFSGAVPKTHNLQRLFLLVEPHYEKTVDESLLIELDTLYIDARYPGEMGLMPNGKPSLNVSTSFYELAKTIFASVKAQVK